MAGCGRAAALTTGRFRQNLANVQEGWGKSPALFVSVADGVELVWIQSRWAVQCGHKKVMLAAMTSEGVIAGQHRIQRDL